MIVTPLERRYRTVIPGPNPGSFPKIVLKGRESYFQTNNVEKKMPGQARHDICETMPSLHVTRCI